MMYGDVISKFIFIVIPQISCPISVALRYDQHPLYRVILRLFTGEKQEETLTGFIYQWGSTNTTLNCRWKVSVSGSVGQIWFNLSNYLKSEADAFWKTLLKDTDCLDSFLQWIFIRQTHGLASLTHHYSTLLRQKDYINKHY